MAEEFAKSLERYDVVDRIAVGGMAEVFLAKAYGAHGFEKTLAIKRILPDLARDPEFEQRFIAEAKVAVKLSHTNIVQVMDFGRFAESLFIAMEYVNGLDLAALLRRFKDQGIRVPIPAAFQIAIEIARGLDYAHQHGVVHRDVSPSNILLSRAGEVKIADFGIAIAARPNRVGTQGGPRKVMGKWRYMSPEQARGEPLDTRSDLFSAASVMYELFTGEKLFPGDEAEDIIKNIHDMSLPRPSKVRDGLPSRLDEILHTALARRSLDRPARASIMLRALTELSYESSIVCTTIDVSDAVAMVLPSDASATSLVDDMIRQQLAGGADVARETAVTDGKKRETALTGDPSMLRRSRRDSDRIDTTGVFRLEKDLDGLSRLEVDAHANTASAGFTIPAPSVATSGAVNATSAGKPSLKPALQELGVEVPFDPDRRTEVGPPLAESRPFFKVDKDEADKTAAREKIDPLDTTGRAPRVQEPDKTPTATATGDVTPRTKRRGWMIVGGAVIVGGVVAFVATRGGDEPRRTDVPVVTPDASLVVVPARKGTLAITTTPEGAAVFVDDKPIGKAPLDHQVVAGSHEVRAELAGYEVWKQTFVVGANAKVEVDALLDRLRVHIVIKSTPPDAHVKINGTDYGETPLDREVDLVGSVTIEVIKPGFDIKRDKGDLVAGKPFERDYTLVPAERRGNVYINVAGPWVIVKWRNRQVGRAAEGQSAPISLPYGTHKLTLHDHASGKQVGNVTVVVDQPEKKIVAKIGG